MKKNTETWRSPSLGKNMKLTIYGTSGTPLIGFPTRGQQGGQWEEYGMVDAIEYQLENGYNQLFCVDTADKESFLNQKVAPEKRLMRHRQYEDYIIEEVVPFIREQTTINYLMIAGVDFGGYHAVNLALKHPQKFDKAIGISGIYNIKPFFDGFYDDNVYYNNPIDFVVNISRQKLLNDIMGVDFRLVSYETDSRKSQAHKLAQIFRTKFIQHKLDIWDLEVENEWDLWQNMLKTHII